MRMPGPWTPGGERPGHIAQRIDRALRARFRDESLKHLVVQFLIAGADRRRSAVHWQEIDGAAREIDPMLDTSRRLADGYQLREGVAYLDVGEVRGFDKTELLLLGQERAPVSVVRDSGSLTIAADYVSGLDFVKMFNLGGGMPTRVTVPDARFDEVMGKALHRHRRAPRAVIGRGRTANGGGRRWQHLRHVTANRRSAAVSGNVQA